MPQGQGEVGVALGLSLLLTIVSARYLPIPSSEGVREGTLSRRSFFHGEERAHDGYCCRPLECRTRHALCEGKFFLAMSASTFDKPIR